MMDLVKGYLIQSIVTASSNLKLNSEKLEIITLLREYFEQSGDLESEIIKMKKKTEFSKLAIKLDQIFNYIAKGKPDFLYLSEKFKEQSSMLITDISTLLEKNSPESFNLLLKDMNRQEQLIAAGLTENVSTENSLKEQHDKLKERIILDDLIDEESFDFEEYEEKILKTVKEVEPLLKRLLSNEYTEEELQDYENKLKRNAEMSVKAGFSLIADMHSITYRALKLLREKRLVAVSPVIEGLRACLIVIVAVVRGKDVDITNYLNRAESFGEKLNTTREELT